MAIRCGLAGALFAASLLAACGEEAGPGGVTAEESRQLNEIAETLDTSPDSLTVSEDAALGNGESGATGELPVVANEATNQQ